MSVLNFLLLFQFAGQNISTRTDGADQQLASTHASPGSSTHATNGGVMASHKRYAVKCEVYRIYTRTHSQEAFLLQLMKTSILSFHNQ